MQRRTIEKAVGDDRFRIYAGPKGGYFYFEFVDGDFFTDSAQTGQSVYVSRLADLPLEQWVTLARDFIVEAENLNPIGD